MLGPESLLPLLDGLNGARAAGRGRLGQPVLPPPADPDILSRHGLAAGIWMLNILCFELSCRDFRPQEPRGLNKCSGTSFRLLPELMWMFVLQRKAQQRQVEVSDCQLSPTAGGAILTPPSSTEKLTDP